MSHSFRNEAEYTNEMLARESSATAARGVLPGLVHNRRIDEPLRDNLRAVGRDLAEKATAIPFMARWTLLIDFQEDGVGVTVDENLDDVLHVTAFFPLAPQASLAAAEIDRPSGGDRLGKALGIHVRHHQHFAGLGVLGDGRQQAVALGEIGNR